MLADLLASQSPPRLAESRVKRLTCPSFLGSDPPEMDRQVPRDLEVPAQQIADSITLSSPSHLSLSTDAKRVASPARGKLCLKSLGGGSFLSPANRSTADPSKERAGKTAYQRDGAHCAPAASDNRYALARSCQLGGSAVLSNRNGADSIAKHIPTSETPSDAALEYEHQHDQRRASSQLRRRSFRECETCARNQSHLAARPFAESCVLSVR